MNGQSRRTYSFDVTNVSQSLLNQNLHLRTNRFRQIPRPRSEMKKVNKKTNELNKLSNEWVYIH